VIKIGKNGNSTVKKAVAIATVLLTFATTAFLASPAKAATVTLTMSSWRVEDVDFYKQVISDFNAANPGIDVKYQSYPALDYQTILVSSLAAGNGADILHVRAYGSLNTLIDGKYLSPLDINEIKGLNKFDTNILNSQRGFTDTRLFGVPFATQNLGIFYNLDVLRKAGINAAPKTYPQFLASLEKLKGKGIQALANGGQATIEQMWGTIAPTFYGGTPFYNDVVSGKKTFSDPAFIKSLDALAKLFPYMPTNSTAVTYDSSRALFFSGKAAYFLGGIFELGYFRANNPDLRVDFMATPPLVAGGKQYMSSWADGGYAINAKTTHRPEAVKFLNYLASKQFGQAFIDNLAQISTVPGTHIKDPVLMKSLLAQKTYATPYLMLVGFRWKNPTGSSILQTEIPMMINGTKTSTEIAADATKAVATWYAPFAGKS